MASKRNKQSLDGVLATAAARKMEQSNPDSRSTSQPFLLKHSDRTPSRLLPRNRTTKATTRNQETRRHEHQTESLATLTTMTPVTIHQGAYSHQRDKSTRRTVAAGTKQMRVNPERVEPMGLNAKAPPAVAGVSAPADVIDRAKCGSRIWAIRSRSADTEHQAQLAQGRVLATNDAKLLGTVRVDQHGARAAGSNAAQQAAAAAQTVELRAEAPAGWPGLPPATSRPCRVMPETPAGEASEARRPTARGRRTPRAGRKASAWRFYRALGGPAAWASRSFRHVVPRSPCPAGHGEQGRRLRGSSTKTLDGRLKLETPTNSVRGHSRDGSAWEAGGGCRM